MNAYILPKFKDSDIANVKFSDILEVLEPLFNPHNPKKLTIRNNTPHYKPLKRTL